MTRKIIFTLVILSILFFAAGVAVYYVPLTETELTQTHTTTSHITEKTTGYVTNKVTSRIQETSTYTTVIETESAELIHDKPYRVGPTGNEFSYLRIKDLKAGDKVEIEVLYKYGIYVKLVDPKGDIILKEKFDGGEWKKTIDITSEGIHTLWVDTLAAPGIFILRVRVKVIYLLSTSLITASVVEEKQVYDQTEKIVEETTYTTTLESYATTLTKTPLQSRNTLTPILIILGLIILVLGLIVGRGREKPSKKVFCINCGQPLEPEDKFCENCGAHQT